jgi:hypothetical protein
MPKVVEIHGEVPGADADQQRPPTISIERWCMTTNRPTGRIVSADVTHRQDSAGQ